MVTRWILVLGILEFLMRGEVCGGPLVVGYYPNGSRSTYPHTAIMYENLTHIAHAFLIPNADGSLAGTSGFAYPELVQNAHARGVKVIVSLGGWGQSDGFSPMAADTAARRRFVDNVKSFCITNGYDGADLDWEYPKSAADRTNMKALVRELRIAFSDAIPPLQLSMAGPSTNWSGQWYDLAGMSSDFHWIGIMTYDYFGSWTNVSGPNSALYGDFTTNTQGWTDNSVEYYSVTRGVPKQKLLIGIPFYGWSFKASSMYGPSTGAVQMRYAAIAPALQQGWTRYWDSVGQVPYLVNGERTQVISYDDSVSVGAKCDYLKAKGVAGAIVWAIGHDYFSGRQPLLNTIGLRLFTGVRLVVGASVPSETILAQNYPNPFNTDTHIRYHVSRQGEVVLKVHDLLGREVSTLVRGEFQPGEYDVTFSSRDLPSGVYAYRLMTQDVSIVKTMVLLR